MNNNIINEINNFMENDDDGKRIAEEAVAREDIPLDKLSQLASVLIPVMTKSMKTDNHKLDEVLGIFDQNKDDPNSLLNASKGFDESKATDEGKQILNAIFGDKENSRKVAQAAAAQTGISDSTIKHILPILATVATKMISGQVANQPGMQGKALKGQGDQLSSMLTDFLDVDKDGTIVDDLFNLASKFLGGKRG